MNRVASIGRNGRDLPQVVEIIGPAGAGKTTLCRMLNDHQEQIRVSDFPNVRKINDAPFFIRYGLGLIPILLRLYRREGRQIRRREFAWLSILMGWPSVLQKMLRKDNKVIILDQGPVYLMAELREFGPEYLRSQAAEKLWQSLYNRWANTLTMIVWLDAADELLFERIRVRDQEHVVKNAPASIVFDFLGRYRRVFEEITIMLEAKSPGLQILRIDTSKQQTDEIAKQLLIKLGCH